MYKLNKKPLKVLYIFPTESKRTGVANYAIEFKKCLESYFKDLEINMENPFYFQTNYSILDLLKIKKEVHLLKENYDLIHAEMSSSSYAEFWYLYFVIKKFQKIPVVITVHDSPYLCLNPFHIFFFENYSNFLLFRFLRKALDFLIGYRLERKMIRKIKFIFVTTKIGSKKFKQRFKISKVDHLPHLPLFGEGKIQERNFEDKENIINILFFGFIRKGKGIEILIDAFHKLLMYEEFRNTTKLILCGGYNENSRYYQDIKRKIKKFGLAKNIEITGYLGNDSLMNLLRKVACCIFPYLSKSTYSSSGALIRALEVGSPVIVSDIPMLTEYVKDGYNGVIFKENDSEDLYAKLLILIRDKQLREKLSRNAIEYIKKNHNSQIIAEKVIRKYTEILAQN